MLCDVVQLVGVVLIIVLCVFNILLVVLFKVLQKVCEVVEKIGYVFNLLVGGLVFNKSWLVVVVVLIVIGLVFQEIVYILIEMLVVVGYQVMLGQSGYENLCEDVLLEVIIGCCFDGVVLIGIMCLVEVCKWLLVSGILVVEIWDLILIFIDMLVGFLYEVIGYEVVCYLYVCGCCKVVVVGGCDECSQWCMNVFVQECVVLGMQQGRGEVFMYYVVVLIMLG